MERSPTNTERTDRQHNSQAEKPDVVARDFVPEVDDVGDALRGRVFVSTTPAIGVVEPDLTLTSIVEAGGSISPQLALLQAEIALSLSRKKGIRSGQ